MTIETKFPGTIPESDVRLLQSTIQAVIGSYNSGRPFTPSQIVEIQKKGRSLSSKQASQTGSAAMDMLSSLFGGSKDTAKKDTKPEGKGLFGFGKK